MLRNLWKGDRAFLPSLMDRFARQSERSPLGR
jgi:hypothetical protein